MWPWRSTGEGRAQKQVAITKERPMGCIHLLPFGMQSEAGVGQRAENEVQSCSERLPLSAQSLK